MDVEVDCHLHYQVHQLKVGHTHQIQHQMHFAQVVKEHNFLEVVEVAQHTLIQ
jgi:uncharacterized protein YpiB (UPF0302 family)